MNYGQLASESPSYRKTRAELLDAEIALKNQRERVADLRRKLPLDTKVEDYLLHEGPADLAANGPYREVRLSGLFEMADKPLIIYQYMYGAAQKTPCPMCTLWTDGFNAIANHLRQSANFAIVAEAEVGHLRDWARSRNWHDLRLVSSAGSKFKADMQFADADGNQYPGVSVFARAADGSMRHFYSGCAIMRDGEYRGLDLLTPLWNFLDLTPGGRGQWMPKLKYQS